MDKENGVKKHGNGNFFKKWKKDYMRMQHHRTQSEIKICYWWHSLKLWMTEGQLEEQEIKRNLPCRYSRIGLTQNITAEHANTCLSSVEYK